MRLLRGAIFYRFRPPPLTGTKGLHSYAPESKEAFTEIGRFFEKHLGK